jgi:hypothetical protein
VDILKLSSVEQGFTREPKLKLIRSISKCIAISNINEVSEVLSVMLLKNPCLHVFDSVMKKIIVFVAVYYISVCITLPVKSLLKEPNEIELTEFPLGYFRLYNDVNHKEYEGLPVSYGSSSRPLEHAGSDISSLSDDSPTAHLKTETDLKTTRSIFDATREKADAALEELKKATAIANIHGELEAKRLQNAANVVKRKVSSLGTT